MMTMPEGLLKLKWNNHQATFCHILHRLRTKPRYADATLACEGRLFMVHRLVLATCSDFFDEIFQQTPSDSTRAVIVLNEARAQDIECLLDYMYCGQVNVRQANLASLLKTAECLKIKGLAVPEAAVSSPQSSKRSQDYSSRESTPVKKKKRKKSLCPLPETPPLAPSGLTSDSPRVVPSTSSSSAVSRPQAMTHPTFCMSSSEFPTISIPETSSPLPLPFLQNSTPTQSHPLTVPLKVTVPSSDADKTSPKSGWLQIVSSMRQGSEMSHANSLHHDSMPSEKSKPSPRSAALDVLASNFLQTEIKKEKKEADVKEEPVPLYLGQDDPMADESNWEPYQEHGFEETSEGHIFHKAGLQPPPALHPVVSSSSLNHASSVLPLGLFRLGSYGVQSGGQAWENSSQLSQSPEPSNHEASPSASQGSMNQATVSPKHLPYAVCSNCGTNNTKLWRRNDKCEIVCNACGLYFKLHGINRPSHLFRTAPMTRRRNPKKKKDDAYCKILPALNAQQQQSGSSDIEGGGAEPLEQRTSDSSQDRETVPETDPQDGLAVLNAALTLNSLLAKAKAHQTATREAALASQMAPPVSNKVLSDSGDSRPPPPPLLKIPDPVCEMESDAVGHEDSPQDPGGTGSFELRNASPTGPMSAHDDEGRKIIAQLLDK
ncbi:hypothetical protein SK128_026845 [Halocaridina rubra]|uniref:Uncharacterized protein n=1 Tax=Halocaridina rubra TaxID=373956 RepID=A0AAN8XCD7_HALRR